jgi:hypothetical protein
VGDIAMFEFILLFLFFWWFFNRKEKRAGRKVGLKKPTLDQELAQLSDNFDDPAAMGSEIKRYLLAVLEDEKNDRPKYSDERLAWGQKILDRTGANGLFFMTDIACQLALLTTATVNGIPTQIDTTSGKNITPEHIIHSIIQI